MKNRPTAAATRKGLMLALPLALLLTASAFYAFRGEGSRTAAARAPVSFAGTVQSDRMTALRTAETTQLRGDDGATKHLTSGSGSRVVEKKAADITNTSANEAGGRNIGLGEASYYGRGFAGRPTANGERFDPTQLTAAHRTLPFGSRIRVTNTDNGRSVVVRVNDRGPYVHGRLIDVSKRAAEVLGMVSRGTARVHLELI